MSEKLHQLTIKWPSADAAHVIVTGSFDNWSKSVSMQRLPEGGFIAQVEVPWDTTVLFKFVQDGNWVIDSEQPHCDDGNGQFNNFYKAPKAPESAPSVVVAAETAATPLADKVESQPAAISEPEVVVTDHVNDTAESAPTVPAAPDPVEAHIVPLAAAVERPIDVVPEASTGLETQAEPSAPSLPIVELLPSTDALPTTTLVESAASESSTPVVVAALEPEAPYVETTPALVADSPLAAVTDSAHAPAGVTSAPDAEVVPASAPSAVDDIVYATSNTDATADAVVAAAKAASPTTVPVTDLVPPATTEETPAKVDSAATEDETTTATEYISEKPAVTLVEKPEETKTTATESTTKPEGTQLTTVETSPNPELRLEDKGSGDRRSRTYSSFKGKLFTSFDHDKTHGVSEDGTAQKPLSPTDAPPREKRKSIISRVVSIFKPSS